MQLLPRPRISVRFAGSGQLSFAAEDAKALGGAVAAQQPPHAVLAARKRRRGRQSGEGQSSQPKGHRHHRLSSVDSAGDAAAAGWPREAKAHWQSPTREPLSPADSASELMEPPSRWYMAGAAPRVISRPQRTHSRRGSSGGRAQAAAAPHTCVLPDSDAAGVFAGDSSQHASATPLPAAASRRRRQRVPHSVFSSRAAAAEALRSHPLSGLDDKDGPAAALADAQQAAQTSAAQPAKLLQFSRQRSGAVPQPAPSPAVVARQFSLLPINVGDFESSQPQLGWQTETAAEALGHEGLGGCPPSVAAVLSDNHLLAFGALIGESATAASLSARGGPQEPQDCLFGAVDGPACPWELVVQVCPWSPCLPCSRMNSAALSVHCFWHSWEAAFAHTCPHFG